MSDTANVHLADDDGPIADSAGHEAADYTGGRGLDASLSDPGPSLFQRTM